MADQDARDGFAAECEGHGEGFGEGLGDQRLEAEGEVALARVIMDGGDLRHAAQHLGGAMATDPRLPEAHEALSELAVRAGGVLEAVELFPMERPFIGDVACRAHLLASAEDFDEAVGLLAAVIAYDPSRPFAQAAWLLRPDLPARLDPGATAAAVARVTTALDDPMEPDVKESVAPFYALARAVVDLHPDEPHLLVMASSLARRNDDLDDAIAFALRAQAIAPGLMPSVMLGTAHRRAGRPDQALAVWIAECERDPSEDYLPVDIAELLASLGRHAEGLPWVDRVLADHPEHEKAFPAAQAIRFQMDGDRMHLVALADHLRAHPDHDYAAQVLAQLSRQTDWLSQIAPATEATINVLRQVLDQDQAARGNGIRLTLSAIEPPSSLLAFLTALPTSAVEYQAVGDPDPRTPVREVTTAVWRYQDRMAEPAVATPSSEGSALIRDVAQTYWPHLPAAYDHAVALASLPLPDLLGALVHPPRPRDDEQGVRLGTFAPDVWIRAVQTFACLGVAHHRTDEPWETSTRRAVLMDLLFGCEDWVNEAAGTALAAIAWTHPELRQEIGEQIAWRMLDAIKAAQDRPVTILLSLCRLTLACPWLQRDVLDLARDRAASLEDEDEDEEPEDGARERERQVVERARRMGEKARSVGDKDSGKQIESQPKSPRFFRRRG